MREASFKLRGGCLTNLEQAAARADGQSFDVGSWVNIDGLGIHRHHALKKMGICRVEKTENEVEAEISQAGRLTDMVDLRDTVRSRRSPLCRRWAGPGQVQAHLPAQR